MTTWVALALVWLAAYVAIRRHRPRTYMDLYVMASQHRVRRIADAAQHMGAVGVSATWATAAQAGLAAATKAAYEANREHWKQLLEGNWTEQP
jgi:hypothetical protein